jgi:hypothetical protein
VLGAVVEEEEDEEEEDGKMHWPVLGEGKEVDGEVEVEKPKVLGKMAARVVDRPVAKARKREKTKWTSWANVAAGVKAGEESSSSSSSSGSLRPVLTPPILTPQILTPQILTPPNDSGSPEAKLPADDEQGEVDSSTADPGPHIRTYDLPLIGSAIPRPIRKPGFWLPPISGLHLSSSTAAAPTASNLPLPTWSPHASSGLRPPPGFEELTAQSGGEAPAPALSSVSGRTEDPGMPKDTKVPAQNSGKASTWSMISGPTEGLNMPVDTTAYIRERHCAGCSLCDLLKSRNVYD